MAAASGIHPVELCSYWEKNKILRQTRRGSMDPRRCNFQEPELGLDEERLIFYEQGQVVLGVILS
jgi:hypothetical protein